MRDVRLILLIGLGGFALFLLGLALVLLDRTDRRGRAPAEVLALAGK